MHRTSRAVVAVTLVAAAVVALSANPASAGGDPPTPQTKVLDRCGQAGWVVPDDVTSVTATVSGAQGGGGKGAYEDPSAAGGLGGRSTATLAVTPGQTLTVIVGCAGQTGAWGQGAAAAGGPGCRRARAPPPRGAFSPARASACRCPAGRQRRGMFP